MTTPQHEFDDDFEIVDDDDNTIIEAADTNSESNNGMSSARVVKKLTDELFDLRKRYEAAQNHNDQLQDAIKSERDRAETLQHEIETNTFRIADNGSSVPITMLASHVAVLAEAALERKVRDMLLEALERNGQVITTSQEFKEKMDKRLSALWLDVFMYFCNNDSHTSARGLLVQSLVTALHKLFPVLLTSHDFLWACLASHALYLATQEGRVCSSAYPHPAFNFRSLSNFISVGFDGNIVMSVHREMFGGKDYKPHHKKRPKKRLKANETEVEECILRPIHFDGVEFYLSGDAEAIPAMAQTKAHLLSRLQSNEAALRYELFTIIMNNDMAGVPPDKLIEIYGQPEDWTCAGTKQFMQQFQVHEVVIDMDYYGRFNCINKFKMTAPNGDVLHYFKHPNPHVVRKGNQKRSTK